MKSYLPFLLIILTFSLLAEKKDDEHLKSRIYFYKNVSEEKLEGWEKDFFKDHSENQPMSVPDTDYAADNEADDMDIIEKSIKPVRKIKSSKQIRQAKKGKIQLFRNMPIIKKAPVEKITTQESEEDEKPDDKIEQPEKKRKEAVYLNKVIPETPEKDVETPDNEVDRSSRIRKMKKLLKKRKGKRRIDKRF